MLDGVIEIYTTTEGHEFVLEKLFRGSIINYRTFYMPDDGKVYYRFGRNSICSTLHFDVFEEIYPKHPELKKKFTKFRRNTITEDKPFPLDYIMNLPKHLQNTKLDQDVQRNAWRLENTLKNVVIRMLTEIRKIKEKPSLKDMIAEYMNKKSLKDERARVRIKE